MYNEPDPANPQGMQRTRLAKKKVYQDDPKTSRPIRSIHSRNYPSRPAVGEGNNPQGMPRPQKPGAPYDQDLDPDY
jgi:hypothetical protein